MTKYAKSSFLTQLVSQFGKYDKLPGSLSLFQLENSDIRIYVRYSKIHGGDKTWYGLRESDLRELEGHPSIIAFIWDDQREPLLVPFSEYEDVFKSILPADDGQYKAQVLIQKDATELYIAKVGRFNVDGYFGWQQLINISSISHHDKIPDLSHSQVQTLIGAIGCTKELDIWIPLNDRQKLDWNITREFPCREQLPYGYENVTSSLEEVDVIWMHKGSNDIKALFEIEHSTPIYSGLLRFNDIHLVSPHLRSRFSIVANDARRSLFIRQINRPTFRTSGLSDLCTFLEYVDVYNWHSRIV